MEDNRFGVAIILGSESDLSVFDASKSTAILTLNGIPFEVSVISAHRNRVELDNYCQEAFKRGFRVFVGVAGMSAALPGDIASIMYQYHLDCPVLGVGLTSSDCPDGVDSMYSIARMPSEMPVAYCGLGKSGLDNAALLACQILQLPYADGHTEPPYRLVRSQTKEAKVAVRSSNGGSK